MKAPSWNSIRDLTSLSSPVEFEVRFGGDVIATVAVKRKSDDLVVRATSARDNDVRIVARLSSPRPQERDFWYLVGYLAGTAHERSRVADEEEDF